MNRLFKVSPESFSRLFITLAIVAIGISSGTAQTPKVFAHYMAWYKDAPDWRHWKWCGHNPDNISNGKRDIASVDYPLIGPYNSADTVLIQSHLLSMIAAGFDGMIIDWYGRGSYEDSVTGLCLRQVHNWKIKYCCDFKIALMVDGEPYRYLRDANRINKITDDIKYAISQYYTDTANVFLYNKKPVILFFPKDSTGTPNDPYAIPPADWQTIIDSLPGSPYIVYHDNLDPLNAKPLPKYDYRKVFNGNYVWFESTYAPGTLSWPFGDLNWYYNTLSNLKGMTEYSNSFKVTFGIAFPGFNDSGVGANWSCSSTYGYIPRNINGDEILDLTWGLFLQRDSVLFQKSMNVQVATFNDWNEGSEIEPTKQDSCKYLQLCKKNILRFKGKNDADSLAIYFGPEYYKACKNGVSADTIAKALDQFFNRNCPTAAGNIKTENETTVSMHIIYSQNRANDIVKVRIPGYSGDGITAVYTITGRKVISMKFHGEMSVLGLGGLANGTYYISVTTSHERFNKFIQIIR